MSKSGFVWVRPPDDLVDGVRKYGQRALAAIHAVAEYVSQQIQDDARKNASWHDRTGNARGGLFSVVEAAAEDIVEIYLSHGHTVEYGKFLELARGGKYAIIMPTIERNLPKINRMLNELFRD